MTIAADKTGFRAMFPEFTGTTDAQINTHIEAAKLSLDVEVWGDQWPLGVLYSAAHSLAMSPFGMTAKLVSSGTTTYRIRFEELQRGVGGGYRVCL